MLTTEQLDKIKYEDVRNITSKEYFSDDEYASAMFDTKYCIKFDNNGSPITATDCNSEYLSLETPADVFMRVASGLADMEIDDWTDPRKDQSENREKYKQHWFALMWLGWFRPGGSVLSGVGSPVIKSLLNCTTIPLTEDSLEGIAKCDLEIMRCAAFRQGLGIDASVLRPRGTPINNAAEESTGSVPWVEKLVDNGKYVGQKGRKPALLISLKDRHPDIIEFVTAKLEHGKLENANISVQISNAFIEAVKSDDDWELYFEFEKDSKYERISKTIKAKELFDLIVETAFESAEPGVQYIDLLRDNYMVHQVYKDTGDERFKGISTNACQPGFATVLTKEGIRTFDDIEVGATIWSGTKWTKVIDKWSNGEKEVNLYSTNAGQFVGTADHKVLQNNKKIEVKFAQAIDICSGENRSCDFYEETVVDGLVIGDGSVHKASNNLVYLNIGKDDYDYFDSHIKHFITKDRTAAFRKGWEVTTTILHEELPKTYERVVPVRFYTGNNKTVRSFLRGLFTANGCVVNGRVCLKQSSYLLIKQVQDMLSSVGISSYITKNKETKVKFSNGTYDIKKSYDINITKDRTVFFDTIGFIQKYKMTKLSNYINNYHNSSYHFKQTYDITSLESLGEHEVFEITVDDAEHTYWTSGCLVSNCSEKFLSAYNVCNLLSPNHEMFSTSKEEYKKELEFIVPYMVRLSDNVVTYELRNKLSPLKDQAWILSQTREIGLGITNVHGWLLKQDLAYDSDEAIERVENFFKYYAGNAFKASMALGQEKGDAPAFDKVTTKALMGSTYFKNIVGEFFDGNYALVQFMRNMAHMSVAPTGSLSSTFPQSCFSYGTEPATGAWWWRRTRAIDKGTYIHYFIVPKKVQDYVLGKLKVDSYDYQVLSEFSGSVLDDDGKIGLKIGDIIDRNLPKGFFKPSHFIDYNQKIKLMSGMYKWVDAAISCTYNLPKTATVEDVENIYMSAYDHGVRAVSVYVDGSREGILIFDDPITNEAKQQKVHFCDAEDRPVSIVPNCAPIRPVELNCEIIHTSIRGKFWVVLVGLLDDKPFELFCGTADQIYLPKACKSGLIRKQGKGRYELEVMIRNSPIVYKDLATLLMTDDERALTRILSLNLRHGVLPRYVVEQLKKSNGQISAFSTAISRVLSKYVGSYDLTGEDNKCPVCGEQSLMFVEGCIRCIELDCAYSRCG